MSAEIVSFDSPPVIEVVLGVQFQALPMTTPHVGLLWQRYRECGFSRIVEKERLESTVERFGVTERALVPQLRLLREVPTNRVWMETPDATELIQVQADRFIFNWRKAAEDSEYPRFGRVLDKFVQAFSVFRNFLSEIELGSVQINQCEVIYVNHIEPADGVWVKHGELSRVIRLCGDLDGGFLPEAESVQMATSFVMSDAEGNPLGRLRARIESQFTNDQEPLVFLQLLARGAPIGPGLDGAKKFFELGRKWIVRGFLDLTTQEMHESWGRRG